MPRFNVQHPVTKEWRCFSTIVDDYVTDWMDEERYQKWREYEYGRQAGEIRDANLMDYEEAEQIIADRIRWEEEDEKQSEKIEVGDEVNWLGDCFIVTRIFQPRNMKEQCDGIDDDGCVYHDVLIKDLEKTGRHFDIASILEAMKA